MKVSLDMSCLLCSSVSSSTMINIFLLYHDFFFFFLSGIEKTEQVLKFKEIP